MICCYSVIGVKCFLIAHVVWMRASNIHYQWKSNWSIFWRIHNSLQSAVTNFDVKYFVINKLISILSFLLTLGSWSLEGISSKIFYRRKWKSIMVNGPRIYLFIKMPRLETRVFTVSESIHRLRVNSPFKSQFIG